MGFCYKITVEIPVHILRMLGWSVDRSANWQTPFGQPLVGNPAK
jgi:hypothetical protein